MMGVTVLSAVFYKNESLFATLKDSCNRMGLESVLYGVGQRFPGFYRAKVVALLEAIRDVKTDHVLFCDGRDSLVLGDEQAILAAYKNVCKASKGKIVFCADRKCFPYPELASGFEERGEGHEASVCLWKGAATRRVFLNAGVFMAETGYLRKCLGRLMCLYEQEADSVAKPKDDQGWWCMAIDRGLVKVAIDYKCELVAMTTYTPDKWYGFRKGKCSFRPTHTEPCVLHFAGRKDTKRRMPRFLEGMGLDGGS